MASRWSFCVWMDNYMVNARDTDPEPKYWVLEEYPTDPIEAENVPVDIQNRARLLANQIMTLAAQHPRL